MRIPWRATLDAFIDELRRHLDAPPSDEELEGLRIERAISGQLAAHTSDGRQIHLAGEREHHPPLSQAQIQKLTFQDMDDSARLLEALIALQKVRMLLPRNSPRAKELGLSPREQSEISGELEDLDNRQVRYPNHESAEGLARFIEHGALIGPILGRHIASVIRGSPVMKHYSGRSYDEGRQTRFTVKRIATIMHAYDVGVRKAVRMFRELEGEQDHDPNTEKRMENWVNREQKKSVRQLAAERLSPEEREHHKAMLYGLRADLRQGHLKGQSFPEAFKKLLKEGRQF